MSSHSNRSKDATANNSNDNSDQVVLDFLRKKGMGGAVLELTQESVDTKVTTKREILERADEHYRNQRSILSKLTGGGFGYDRDTAWPVLQWGMPEIKGGSPVLSIGLDEANMYVESFITLQLRVLALSDTKPNHIDNLVTDEALADVATLVQKNYTTLQSAEVVAQAVTCTNSQQSKQGTRDSPVSASEKPELMAVTFALFVHTYCELLELGMESSAHRFRDSFRPLYAAKYPDVFQDLVDCNSTESVIRLNTNITHHVDFLSNLKQILAKIRQQELCGQELRLQQASGKAVDIQLIKGVEQKITDLKQKHKEFSQKAVAAFRKKHEFPCLRRIRGAKWQLTLSTQTFHLLCNLTDTPMNTLLQTKCEVHVERRGPLDILATAFLHETESSTEELATLVWKEREMKAVPVMEYKEQQQSPADLVSSNSVRNKKREVFSRSTHDSKKSQKHSIKRANALDPTIFLSTLASNSKGPFIPKRRSSDTSSTDVAAIWNEPGVSVCCMRMCPPDGTRIAGGCDDSRIRIWSRENSSTIQELSGHQNGFPVFCVEWNLDGRHLLSGGGDGAVRLWDTWASSKDNLHQHTTAERAVFSGHTPGSSIWSVSFSPAGYYFVSTGSDSAARVWTTDRQAPVRLLAGHTSSHVHSSVWHPNNNYILTGADDKTARFWDVQTGRTVRLLDGCQDPVHSVAISPDGKCAAVADCSGAIYVWDLGTGKMLAELKAKEKARKGFVVNALKFSSCGETLASAGDDCCIRVWDVRNTSLSSLPSPGVVKPHKSFTTKNTVVMDLAFTQQNLLLAAGKSVTPIPKANPD